jgi:hypothetical protein
LSDLLCHLACDSTQGTAIAADSASAESAKAAEGSALSSMVELEAEAGGTIEAEATKVMFEFAEGVEGVTESLGREKSSRGLGVELLSVSR